jgi:arginase
MQICLIQVPYAMGSEQDGGSKGPQRYVQAGAQQLLEAQGLAVTRKHVERGTPFRDTASASSAVNTQLAQLVRQAIAAEQLPLVLAGSCDASLGILAGFDHARCGVVWFDAHADFNTPDSTVSGFFAGMSLAIITGHCYRNFWAQIGESTPIAEAATLLLGVRDLSPQAERERLHHSAIQIVNWSEGKPQGDVLACLDTLAKRVQEVYLHIDLDAFDPQVAPGLVDPPVPGGLSMPQMEETIRATTARFCLRAVALATYNPDCDQDEKTLRTGLRIIELLAECIGRRD